MAPPADSEDDEIARLQAERTAAAALAASKAGYDTEIRDEEDPEDDEPVRCARDRSSRSR
jgi:hypothetical protein